jgi:formate hydrogenlyase subunit 3/multisubunit Na+/H+ antiporter MnhD subunit
MLIVVLVLPLLAAIAAWALDKLVPTRHIGYVAIGSLFMSAMLLLGAGLLVGLPIQLLNVPWMSVDTLTIMLTLRFDELTWIIAITILLVSAAGMIGLIHSLPYQLRNYGRLISLILLHVTIIMIGVTAQDSVLRVFAWSLAALVGGLMMRLSGALPGSDTPLISVVGGISGALLLLGAIMWRIYAPAGPLPLPLIIAWSGAGMLAMGLFLFHGYVASLCSAPAILSIFLVPIGVPLLGAMALIDLMVTQGPLIADQWRTGLQVVAVVATLGSATGAISATRLRTLLGWHASAQFATLAVVVFGDVHIFVTNAPILLLTSIVTTSTIALAIAYIEARSNSDEMTQLRPRARIGFAGMMLLIAVATSIGLPGTIGFMTRWWIAEIALVSTPWVIIAMLISSSLLGLAWSVALASVWRRTPRGLQADQVVISAIPVWGAWIGPIVLCVGMIGAGIFPLQLWQHLLIPIQRRIAIDVQVSTPSMPSVEQQIGLIVMALLIVVIPLIAGRTSQRQAMSPHDGVSVTVPPQATAESLGFLIGIVQANWLLSWMWRLLLLIGNGVQALLRLGEDRYYVAGLVLGLIVVVLMMI